MTLWKKIISYIFKNSHILEFEKYLVTAVQAQCVTFLLWIRIRLKNTYAALPLFGRVFLRKIPKSLIACHYHVQKFFFPLQLLCSLDNFSSLSLHFLKFSALIKVCSYISFIGESIFCLTGRLQHTGYIGIGKFHIFFWEKIHPSLQLNSKNKKIYRKSQNNIGSYLKRVKSGYIFEIQ